MIRWVIVQDVELSSQIFPSHIARSIGHSATLLLTAWLALERAPPRHMIVALRRANPIRHHFEQNGSNKRWRNLFYALCWWLTFNWNAFLRRWWRYVLRALGYSKILFSKSHTLITRSHIRRHENAKECLDRKVPTWDSQKPYAHIAIFGPLSRAHQRPMESAPKFK